MDESGWIVRAPAMRHPDHAGENGKAQNKKIEIVRGPRRDNDEGNEERDDRNEAHEQLGHRVAPTFRLNARLATYLVDDEGERKRYRRSDKRREIEQAVAKRIGCNRQGRPSQKSTDRHRRGAGREIIAARIGKRDVRIVLHSATSL